MTPNKHRRWTAMHDSERHWKMFCSTFQRPLLCFCDSSDLYVKEMPLILKNRCSSPIAQLVVNTCGPPIRCNLIFWWCCLLCGSIPALSGGNSTEADFEKLWNYSVSTGENREIIFAFLLVEAAIITVWVRPQKRQNPFVVAESC